MEDWNCIESYWKKLKSAIYTQEERNYAYNLLFAIKHQQFKKWFLQANPGNPSEKPRYYKCITHTKILYNSAIP